MHTSGVETEGVEEEVRPPIALLWTVGSLAGGVFAKDYIFST